MFGSSRISGRHWPNHESLYLLHRAVRICKPLPPDGEYVVIQFKTSFENKKAAIETITPMLDKDGKWKVSGYFIK